ncbi:MAG: hypothetical protein B7Y26_04725 [Hydrogenophilales bacterium 16-64-46]|nr:MAG: hypothetical protein B7Z32_04465 [Hydrogenophilales bacterium 12-64-13]OYZ06277.1 MAG: hypothetical protein B7Y26_04725 [Hydrogenophilales bacterium 16-64-46]OZA38824.1 MAG: hypothetical protein B7X87_05165 [Hydrogenophilales bacterium 17-64-34]HQS99541.1 TonB-dependent hemoglobin/transferrin/lactoferrin family receptor [Thiobacillus sp.]
MTRQPLALALAVAFSGHGLCFPAAAETVLGTVSVEAEAPDTDSDETATVTSITAEQLSRDMAVSIKDAVRYEPGVSVSNNPSRFGLAGFNIRGVDGNRVAMQIDGVRLPDEFKIGGFSNAGRNMVDLTLLKKIDIQRGSASALYGSGALGGAVAYITPEPEDWLGDSRTIAGGIETQYNSANDSSALIPTLAAGNDALKLLLRGVRRKGTETENRGDLDIIGVERTAANPQDDDLVSGLLKVALTPNADLRTVLTLEGYARDIDTHVLSIVRGLTKDATADDRYRRQRISLDQRIAGLPIGTLDLKLYGQTSRTEQDTLDDREPISQVYRHFEVDQDIVGLKATVNSVFEWKGAHTLQWGLDISRRETIQLRDGYEFDIATGTYTPVISGVLYPDRDFPPSTMDEIALFAQDTWLLSEQWSAILGVRYDRYKLDPDADAIYLGQHRPPGEQKDEPHPVSTDAFTPKLGAVWRFASHYELKAQYAWGFRAPPYDDVNFGFSNPAHGYTTLPNPDLEPEYSQGPELSLRRTHTRGWWSITAFDTHYENFIENEELECPGDPLCDPGGLQTFQPRNLDKVRIYGLEAGFSQQLAPNWRVRGSLAYARGRDDTGNPIDSVNPLNAVLGLVWQWGDWEVESALTIADAKGEEDARRNEDSGDILRQFLSKGYAVLDLRTHWQFAKTGRVSLGVLNVFDVKYAQWADVPVRDPAHIADSGFGADRYTQPGRNFALNFSYDFK